MPEYFVRRLLILGAFAILGIIFIQSYWVIKTWDLKDQEFDQTVRIALRNVAESLAEFNQSELPKQDLVQRQSSNLYAVNVNSVINTTVLEDFLYREFSERSLTTNFEYHVFDCASQNLVYGNYCTLSDEPEKKNKPVDNIETKSQLRNFDDLIYYFVVKFPDRSGYLIANMRTSVLFSMVAFFAIAYFIYTMIVIIRQKKLTEMQKDFINNMTHEFKTPISTIKIAADVIGQNQYIIADPRLSKYASIIKDQNSRLNNQVEKVLSLAKLEKDGFKLQIENVNLKETLMSIVKTENLRISQNPNKPIEINLDSAAEEIMADKLHFSNVVYNILDNAIKYSKEIPDVKLTTRKEKTQIVLEIADQGIGVSKEEISKLFTQFYRVPTGNIHNVKGFGLGLFYVKNICEEHGWKIHFDSKLGHGSIFKLMIPYKQ